jgi:hypothetical protein
MDLFRSLLVAGLLGLIGVVDPFHLADQQALAAALAGFALGTVAPRSSAGTTALRRGGVGCVDEATQRWRAAYRVQERWSFVLIVLAGAVLLLAALSTLTSLGGLYAWWRGVEPGGFDGTARAIVVQLPYRFGATAVLLFAAGLATRWHEEVQARALEAPLDALLDALASPRIDSSMLSGVAPTWTRDAATLRVVLPLPAAVRGLEASAEAGGAVGWPERLGDHGFSWPRAGWQEAARFADARSLACLEPLLRSGATVSGGALHVVLDVVDLGLPERVTALETAWAALVTRWGTRAERPLSEVVVEAAAQTADLRWQRGLLDAARTWEALDLVDLLDRWARSVRGPTRIEALRTLPTSWRQAAALEIAGSAAASARSRMQALVVADDGRWLLEQVRPGVDPRVHEAILWSVPERLFGNAQVVRAASRLVEHQPRRALELLEAQRWPPSGLAREALERLRMDDPADLAWLHAHIAAEGPLAGLAAARVTRGRGHRGRLSLVGGTGRVSVSPRRRGAVSAR